MNDQLIYAVRHTPSGNATATLDAMPPTRGLTVDLTRVTFCDASGLGVLVGPTAGPTRPASPSR